MNQSKWVKTYGNKYQNVGRYRGMPEVVHNYPEVKQVVRVKRTTSK